MASRRVLTEKDCQYRPARTGKSEQDSWDMIGRKEQPGYDRRVVLGSGPGFWCYVAKPLNVDRTQGDLSSS
jgi:hypothetical protein